MDKTLLKVEEPAEQITFSHPHELCPSTAVPVSQPPLSTGTLSFTPREQAQPVLLSTLETNRCRIHRGENNECWGTLYKPGDDVTFYVETNDVENTTVVIEFYLQEIKPLPKDGKQLISFNLTSAMHLSSHFSLIKVLSNFYNTDSKSPTLD